MSVKTRRLTRYHVHRLEAFRIHRRLDIQQLKLTMDAPFTATTLSRALAGQSIYESTYRFIVRWIDTHIPENPAPDGKAAAANDLVCSE